MAVRAAAAYSPFHRSKTDLVYTTEDLRVRFVDRTHFFGRSHPEKRAYPLRIGKVGLVLAIVEEWSKQRTNAPHPETAVWLAVEQVSVAPYQ